MTDTAPQPIQIINRWTHAVIYTAQTATTLAAAVLEAVAARVRLADAILGQLQMPLGADLSGADLRPTIAPQVGKRYVTRNGWITPPMEPNDHPYYLFRAGGQTWCVDGSFHPCKPNKFDLIAEHTEPSAGEIEARDKRIAELEARVADQGLALNHMGELLAAAKRQVIHDAEQSALAATGVVLAISAERLAATAAARTDAPTTSGEGKA